MLRIAEYTGQLLRFATIDQMTGALNRRSFHERGLMELARARRYRRTSSILMIDVDHFKDINDTYGHAAGDQVLGALGACLAECVRPSDLLGRLGGEEFGILLVETALANAVAMAERIRREVAALKVAVGAGEIAFTISLGVSELSPEGEDLGSAMDRADRSLYEAKRSGRNRVAVLPAVAPLEDRVTQPPGRQASRAL
jgi:diguanylate cyclase (GGDEF)-like protein